MLVSIIVPCYNNEKTIEKTVESILNQNYKKIEVILINDGSSDNTALFCEKYRKSDSRVSFYTIKNSGPSIARNYGISKATGDYIMFVDADDFIESNAIDYIVKNIEKKQYDIVFFGYTRNLIRGGEVLHQEEVSYPDVFINNNEEFRNIFQKLSNKGLIYQVWNKVYNHDFIRRNMARFPEGINVSEDFLFNLILYKEINTALILSKSLYNYTSRDSGSLTTTFNHLRFNQIVQVYEISKKIIFSWNPDYLIELDNHFLLDISVCINNLFNRECEYSCIEKRDYIKQICQNKVVKDNIYHIKPNTVRNRIIKVLLKLNCIYTLYIIGKISRIKV